MNLNTKKKRFQNPFLRERLDKKGNQEPKFVIGNQESDLTLIVQWRHRKAWVLEKANNVGGREYKATSTCV